MLVTNAIRKGLFFLAVAITSIYMMISVKSAQAADVKALVDRLERLERDIRTLNIQISRGRDAIGAKVPVSAGGVESLSTDGMSRLTMRLDSLEQDIRSATGSLEQLGHGIRQLTERLDRLVSDVDFRLTAFEEKLVEGSPKVLGRAVPHGTRAGYSNQLSSNVGSVSASPGGVEAPEATETQKILGTVSARSLEEVDNSPDPDKSNSFSVKPTKVQPHKTASTLLPAGKPREQYTYALNLLRQTKYDQAEIALTQFITMQAEHPLAGNARYWLGETYYVRADYEQAAQTFFSSYRVSPKNVKAPDMLLKLGMSLYKLKKTKEACATFDKLIQDFPSASTRINSAVTRERKRASC